MIMAHSESVVVGWSDGLVPGRPTVWMIVGWLFGV